MPRLPTQTVPIQSPTPEPAQKLKIFLNSVNIFSIKIKDGFPLKLYLVYI